MTTALAVALCAALAYALWLRRQVAGLTATRESYREIATAAVVNLEAAANARRAAAGLADFDPVAPVVPEHSSPVTDTQQATADLQTMRARLVAATLELGLPPRSAGGEVTP